MVHPTTESRAVRLVLIGVALALLALFLVMPLVVVFQQALEKGLSAYLAAIREPDALSALRLTLLTAAIAVPSWPWITSPPTDCEPSPVSSFMTSKA